MSKLSKVFKKTAKFFPLGRHGYLSKPVKKIGKKIKKFDKKHGFGALRKMMGVNAAGETYDTGYAGDRTLAALTSNGRR